MDYFKYAYEHGHIRFSSDIYKVTTYHYNWHEEIELLVVLKGAIEVCHDGAHTILEKDDFIIYSTQCGHATMALEEDTVAIVIHLDPNFYKAYNPHFRQYRFCYATTHQSRYSKRAVTVRQCIMKLMMRALELSNEESDFASYGAGIDEELSHKLDLKAASHGLQMEELPRDLRMEALFYQLGDTLYDLIHEERCIQVGLMRRQKQEEVFRKMIEYIDTHYTSHIDLGTLAKIGNYNESYTSQFFKLNLGITFIEYVLRLRLRDAVVQLVSTDDLVVDIASQCGFSDLKAFNRTFKKVFHTTPSAYRKQAKEITRETVVEGWKEYIQVKDLDILELVQQGAREFKDSI